VGKLTDSVGTVNAVQSAISVEQTHDAVTVTTALTMMQHSKLIKQ